MKAELTQQETARVGSLVWIQIPNGIGRHGQEWKEVKARVHIVCPTHLVCVVGGREARPYCAESYRLIRR
jgi:hypothetical protein